MTLQEALNKAGPNGKWWRGNTAQFGTLFDARSMWTYVYEDLVATDWEAQPGPREPREWLVLVEDGQICSRVLNVRDEGIRVREVLE